MPPLGASRDQQMVEPDLAELVDDHRRVRHAGLAQRWDSSVVLPLPRKPVSTETGEAGRVGGDDSGHVRLSGRPRPGSGCGHGRLLILTTNSGRAKPAHLDRRAVHLEALVVGASVDGGADPDIVQFDGVAAFAAHQELAGWAWSGSGQPI